MSSRLGSLVSLLAAHNSFAQASPMLQELPGIRVDDNTIAETAEQVGRVVLARQEAALAESRQRRRPPEAQVRPQRLYVSADGRDEPTDQPINWSTD